MQVCQRNDRKKCISLDQRMSVPGYQRRFGSTWETSAISGSGYRPFRHVRLNPHHPERFWSHLGKAYFTARQYAEAIEAFMRISTTDHIHHTFLAASYGWLGDKTAAAAHTARIRALEPEFDIEAFLGTLHYANEADLQHFLEGWSKAGALED